MRYSYGTLERRLQSTAWTDGSNWGVHLDVKGKVQPILLEEGVQLLFAFY